jgi:hypothetical protein
MEGPNAPDKFIPKPKERCRIEPPETISGWKALADGYLTSRCCAFHRNVQISSCYAWMYELSPACFKWAAMAAIASHHVRLALYPLRLDTDRAGHPGSLSTPRDVGNSLIRRRAALIDDINTIRSTNNAIFDDIFWVHLAYLSDDDGIERLRALLRVERHYAPVLAGFETIDLGRRLLRDRTASESARRMAEDLIWDGNVQLLEHEQRALVQPNFERLSGAFGRLISVGSATTFEVHGARQNAAYFSSFYLSSLRHVVRDGRRGRSWPRITRFEDRWRWLSMSIVPRFRKFDADPRLIRASLGRIANEARVQASTPCVLPRVRRSAGRRSAHPRPAFT